MKYFLVLILSMLAASLEAATITNWGAQLPNAVPNSSDVILMQQGGVTRYFKPSQLATNLSTNAILITTISNSVIAEVIVFDTAMSNALYTSETTRNATVSNAVANSKIGNLNGSGTNATFYTALNLAASALPTTSNSVDVGSHLLPVRTNWVNNMVAKAGVRGPIYDSGGQVYNVKAYGAVGDGVTDDYLAFKAAIDASSPTGGVVFIPPGYYKITNGLVLKKSTRIIGSGKSHTDSVAGIANLCVLDFTSIPAGAKAISGSIDANSANVELAYFRMVGVFNVNNNDTAIYPGYFGIHANIHDVSIYGFTRGIHVEYGGLIKLDSVVTEGTYTNGLWLDNASHIVGVGNSFANSVKGPNILMSGACRSIALYDTVVDECFGSCASVQITSGTDISLNNTRVLLSQSGYGIRLGNGITSPSRVTLNNVRVDPFAGGYTPINTILAAGTNHNFINVTTSRDAGGDISDTSVGTTYFNVNSNSVLRGTVGIGAPAVYAPLQVTVPTTATNTPLLRLENPDGGGAGSRIDFTRLDNMMARIKTYYVSGSDFSLQLGTQNVPATMDLQDGKVGIGTATPSSSLDATGQVRSASAIFTNSVTVVGTTNQLIFGNTNPAPASAASPTKWISVQVTGDATLYRLPLYQ